MLYYQKGELLKNGNETLENVLVDKNSVITKNFEASFGLVMAIINTGSGRISR